MKKRKGVSLVEVMVSFVLIGFLVLMVGGAVTSTYQTSNLLQKLPSVYYKGQQEIENELDDLNQKVTKKYLYEKELGSLPAPDPELTARLHDINDELADDHEILTYHLFGKTVVVYQFEKESTVNDVGMIRLCAGTAGGVRFERPTPVLEDVKINVIGQSPQADVCHASGSILTSTVTYSETNIDYCYTELYQWYVSTGDIHSVYYSDGTPGPDEIQHGVVMPVYPGNFTLITSERTSNMVISDDYRGKFLFCLVTPLSINGKMGESMMSNLIYVSDIPDGLSYKAVIDPSLMVLDYSDTGRQYCPILDSTSAAVGTFTVSSGSPYIDLYGEMVSENSESSSRFLHIGAGVTMQSANGLRSAAGDRVFAVVRNNDSTYPNFLTVGGSRYGFANYTEITPLTYGGWTIMTIDIASSGQYYKIENGSVDIAELIIVSGPSYSGSAEILTYLKNKYVIS